MIITSGEGFFLINTSSRKETSRWKRVPDWAGPGPLLGSACFWSEAGFLLDVLVPVDQVGSNFGSFVLDTGKIVKPQFGKMRVIVHATWFLGALPPLRRCDQEDGWLRTRANSREMILAYLFPLQPIGQALQRCSIHAFSDKNIPRSVPFLSPSDELFLCLTVPTKMCCFWPFVLYQKYGNLSTRQNESQRKSLRS